MISRLTAAAALFAVIATASLSFAASTQVRVPAAAAPLPVVQLEPVVIVGTRRTQQPR
jgi:hypothetical protein